MSHSLRKRRARQQREGVTIIIVLLIITLAMSTGVFALQNTSGAQRAAAAYAEGNWTKSVAEGCAMAALMVHKNGTQGQQRDQRWEPGGAFIERYGLPAPNRAINDVDAVDMRQTNLFRLDRFPNGINGFLVPKDGASPYGQAFGIRRTTECRWLRISVGTIVPGSVAGPGVTATPEIKRYAITGIGEVRLATDPTDTSATGDGAQRGLHTRVAIARAYIDASSQ